MNNSVWHPFSELPSRSVDLGECLYILITNGEFVSTAMFQPITECIAPVVLDENNPCRRWQHWDGCRFTNWCYVDDLLKYFELC